MGYNTIFVVGIAFLIKICIFWLKKSEHELEVSHSEALNQDRSWSIMKHMLLDMNSEATLTLIVVLKGHFVK